MTSAAAQMFKVSPAALFFFLQRLPNHVPADQGKQGKGNPVGGGLDIPCELCSEKPAAKRHQRLKSSKPQPRCAGAAQGDFSSGQPMAYRGGEGIHGEAAGDEQKFSDPHANSVPFLSCITMYER